MSPKDKEVRKRRRIGQACESCRRRKSKCDGTQPICKICKSHSRNCVYESSGRKRGLEVGYVRSMETILGVLIQTIPEAEKRLRKSLRSPKIGMAFLNTTFTDKYTDSWHRSPLYDDIKSLLGSHQGSNDQSDQQGYINYLSPIEHCDDLNRDIQSTSSLPTPTSPSIDIVGIRAKRSQTADHRKLPSNALELVNHYFLHIHPWFPIVERRDILYITHAFNRPEDPSVRDEGLRTCLLSIIALVSASRPHTTESSSSLASLVEDLRHSVLHSDRKFEAGHIQAGLLLTMIDIGYEDLDLAWISLGTVSRMIISYSDSSMDPVNRLPHIVRGCRMLDVLLSHTLQKPLCASLSALCEIAPDEDVLDEWEVSAVLSDPATGNDGSGIPLRCISIFNLAFRLLEKLRAALCVTQPRPEFQTTLQIFHLWKSGIPSYCKTPLSTATPCVLMLQLLYNFCITTVLTITQADSNKTSVAKNVMQTTLRLVQELIQRSGMASPLIGLHLDFCLGSLGRFANVDNSDGSVAVMLTALSRNFASTWRRYKTTHRQRVFETEFTEYVGSPLPQRTRPSVPPTRTKETLSVESTRTGLVSRHDVLDKSFTHYEVFQGQTMKVGQAGSGDISPCPQFVDNDLEAFIDTDFDTLLSGVPFEMGGAGFVADYDFAENLGFPTQAMDHDFLAFFEDTNHPI